MLIDIFSSFDPDINYFSSYPLIFWLFSLTIISSIQVSFWVRPRWTFWLISSISTIIIDQVHRTTGLHLKGFNSILSPLFIIIIFSNLIGLIPYVFRTTSHLLFTLSYALPLWLILVISATLKAPKSTIAHLLPANTPAWLSPPLVLIETVSIIVRPITLSFRLAANIRAGHIVLCLIGIYLSSTIFTSVTYSLLLILVRIGYIIFEIGICLIQAYIFCLLLSLYADEHPTS